MVVSVGIDVSKDKHDCFIVSSEGEVLADAFIISNTLDGFHDLLQRIQECTAPQDKIKVGLEATGHYSYNLLGFLLDNGLATYVLNPLRTNLYRKSLSLRKTKTDRVDARTIASMLLSDAGLKPYTDTAYHNEELKSLTRYRFDKVKERAKLKSSIARLVCILFPELEKLVPSLHIASVYALLEEFPGAKQIAATHLTRLKALLETASNGHYKRDMALEIRDAARNSIGSWMPAKSLELQHTIRLIRELDVEIAEIEEQIQSIMDELHSPITTIPGVGFRMAAMILAEVGDFTRFDSPDKLLAYAGMSPLNLPIRTAQKLLPAHGKAWFPILTLRTLQRSQVCLSLGSDFCRLSCQETGGRQALQCCHFPCSQKAGSADICYGKIRSAVPLGCLTSF